MKNVARTKNLTKRYGEKIAVNNVCMNIERGDIYGFIGRNGAGKTTTMKLLLGTSYPTSGSIELFGGKNLSEARQKIGSLIEAPGLYKNCTAYENMKRFSILYGGDDKQIKDILNFVGLGGTGEKKAGAFSLGMRQRLGIALAMLGNPEFLVLDEPINGLDPAGIKEVRDLILKLNKEREMTILVSSHLLDELSKITTRYGIINSGALVEEISAKELSERCKKYLRIAVDRPAEANAFIHQRAPEWNTAVQGGEIRIYEDSANSVTLNDFLVKQEFKVSEIAYARDDFEDYFIKRIGV